MTTEPRARHGRYVGRNVLPGDGPAKATGEVRFGAALTRAGMRCDRTVGASRAHEARRAVRLSPDFHGTRSSAATADEVAVIAAELHGAYQPRTQRATDLRERLARAVQRRVTLVASP